MTSTATSVLNWTDPRARDRETGEGRPDGLDWQAFSARYFPDRRRHDLEVLTAYGAYKMPRREKELPSTHVNTPARSAEDRVRSEQVDGDKMGSAAVQAWEEEGGALS
jgi:hypothetical protein